MKKRNDEDVINLGYPKMKMGEKMVIVIQQIVYCTDFKNETITKQHFKIKAERCIFSESNTCGCFIPFSMQFAS